MNNKNLENQNLFFLPNFIVDSVTATERYLPKLLIAQAWRENPNRKNPLRADCIENTVKVMKYLITHFDAVTQKVIMFTPEHRKVNAVNLKIAKALDIGKSTLYTAYARLRGLGFYTTTPQNYLLKELPFGMQYTFFSTSKSLTPQFFDFAGTTQKLEDYRTWLKNRPLDKIDNEVLSQGNTKIWARKYDMTASTTQSSSKIGQDKLSMIARGDFPPLQDIIKSYDKNPNDEPIKKLLQERLDKKGRTLSEARREWRIVDPNNPNKEEAEREAYGFTLAELTRYPMDFLKKKSAENDEYFSRLYLTRIIIEQKRRE